MKVPFTPEQFMDVFQRYNLDIWPMQVVAYLLGAVALLVVARRTSYSDRVVSGVLAFLWLWVGAVFHVIYSTPINPAAYVFGALFLLQGLLFLYAGVLRGEVSFRFRADWISGVGVLLILYAMVLDSMLGALSGHAYPRAPIFGVAPCPLVIFTFGLFLWARDGLPRYLLVIPFL